VVAALTESLLSEAKLPALLADANTTLEAEVADKGLIVKGGFAAVKKVGPSVVPDALAALVPEFVKRLEPYWNSYIAAGAQGSFADTLVAQGDDVAEALLAITDEKIAGSNKTAIKKIYSGLRDSAKKNVIEALPRVGELIQRNA
jgi:hypothetical protein